MLIEFSVANYLSFKDKKTLSMEATAIKEFPENVIDAGRYKVLRSAVIYGANSSGKSNLIKALETMRDITTYSGKYSSKDEINVTPFLLNTATENKPSFFEVLILIDGIRYRYGFEVDGKQIHSEWLFECKANTEKQLFIRDKNNIEITDDFPEGKGVEDKTRDNALFLSIVDQFNGSIAKKIVDYFDNEHFLFGLHHENEKVVSDFLLTMERDNSFSVKDFLKILNLGIKKISVDKKKRIVTYHNKFNKEGDIIGEQSFELLTQESSGTNKIYDLAGSIILYLSLKGILVIDELDAKLHPLLTLAIVRLFNSPQYNKQNTQLIFATHDTNLLTSGNFRRDQIYFTEKDRFEATDLYSLVEYKDEEGKKVRNDRSFESDYIEGRYGAIPYIGDFSKLIANGKGRKN